MATSGRGVNLKKRKDPMTFKTLSAVAIVTAAIGSPVFAQDMTADGAAYHRPASATRHFRNAYNQAPAYIAPRASDGWFTENYGADRSRPGGLDPDFNPAAN
jgi:hypothetical protein